MSSSKRMAKRVLSAILTLMMLMSMVTIGITTTSAANVEIVETAATAETMRLYFQNNWLWTDIKVYFWGSSTATNPSWSGYSMTFYENDGTYDVYYYDVPTDVTGVIFNGVKNDGSGNRDQTPDIKSGWEDGLCYYMVWNNGNAVGTNTDYIVEETTVAETTVAETTVVETTVAETTVAETTVAETTVAETTVVETTVAETTVAETTVAETTVAETTVAETDPEETTVAETTVVETTVAETTVAETTVAETTVAETTAPTDVDVTLDWATENGLHAYAAATVGGANAWSRWYEVSGVRYFYLPATASDTEVVLYSTYSEDVTVNGVTIAPDTYETVPYTEGTTYTCSGATTQKLVIYKSDAEGAVYVNSADGMSLVYEDGTKADAASTDLYSFLTGGTKNREGKAVGGAVASATNGVNDEALIKKIKGRGNSTWSETKKPFNITYNSNIELDGMKGKKWSLLANAKDGSLLRNRLVYDMANEVDMTYACDSRFVDFYVNGYYKGSYQLTQKIEMGKNTVMPDLEEPEVEDVIDEDTGETIEYPKTDFDFILELDTEENAASSGDKGFTTTEGQWMTFKTPDDPADEQIEFIKAKYQAVEDALYGDDMATLAELIDIDDFAKAYLINEVSKNIDSGVTSCYFTYNSADGKFYASPVWDYDNSIGNLPDNSARTDMSGKTLDLDGPSGWYARELKHYARNARSIFSEAWYNTSETADGETFAEIVKRVWDAEFAGLVDILEGTTAASGRLNTVEGYMANLAKSGAWNFNADGAYVDASWKANTSSLTMYDYDAEANTLSSTTKTYNESTFEGQADYAGDWLISRLNWMAAQYASAESITPETPVGYINVYFQNNWLWTNVCVHTWGSSLQADTTWPGTAMTYYANDGTYDIYVASIPSDCTGIIFNGTKNDGSGSTDQTPNIEGGWYEGICYYMTWNNGNSYGTFDYNVPEETTTVAPTTVTDPAESSTATDPAETTTVVTDPEETTTVATDPAETTTVVTDPAETTTVATDPAETTTVVTDPAETTTVATDPAETTTVVTDPAETTTVVTDPEETTTVATDPTETSTTPVDTVGYINVYFQNNWLWTNVCVHTWGSSLQADTTWPGTAMTYYANDGTYDIYVASIPSDCTGIIFNGTKNDGSGSTDQTPNIEGGWYEGICYYMTWNNGNSYGTFEYKVPEETTTVAPTTVTDPAESSTATEPVTETTVVTDPVESSTATEPVTETTVVTDPVETSTATTPVETSTATEPATSEPTVVTYAVTWVESDNYAVTTDMDATAVEEGTDFTFTVTAADGYKVAAVIVDMNVIEAVDGVYTINVTKDTTILVITAEDTKVPEVMTFTVTFTDKDGNVLSEQTVEYGKAATAPEAPEVEGYTFTGWSEEFDYVTKDITVKAEYKKVVTPATTGKLQIEVSGGTGFTITVGDGAARPQGTTYLNTKAPINTSVTLVASTSNGNEFIGWMNANTGSIVSTSETYTFTTSGNDFVKAIYKTDVESVNLVIFKNDKANGGLGQILDMQYYAAGDEIVTPDNPGQAGYVFAGWNMTSDEIQAELAAGNDVTVLATWTVREVYYTVAVNGGSVTANSGMNDAGQYLANKGVQVTADAAEDGMKFAYWVDQDGKVKSYDSVYVFYPAKDVELTAVYVAADAAIDYEVLVDMSADPTVETGKIAFTYTWCVPEESEYEFVLAGIILVNKDNYKEETFYHGTTDTNVTDYAPGSASQKASNTRTTNKSGINEGETWVGACWVIYKDADGVEHTVYSELVETTKY